MLTRLNEQGLARGDSQRLLIIGEAPNATNDCTHPCEGRVGRRLAELFGTAYEQYVRETDRINIVVRSPGRSNWQGMAFPRRLMPRRLRMLCLMMTERHSLILGKRAATVLGLDSLDYFRWHPTLGGWVAIIPHPSGRNRWWNSLINRRCAVRFMHQTWRYSGGIR